MKLRTSADYPPIPINRYDWSCVDDNTFDADFDYEAGHYVSNCPVGHGVTEFDAVVDFVLEYLQKIDFSVTEYMSTNWCTHCEERPGTHARVWRSELGEWFTEWMCEVCDPARPTP